MAEIRRSSRLAYCAVKQRARPPVDSRAGIEKYAFNDTNQFSQTCKNKRCKTCPELCTLLYAVSNVTKHRYSCINLDHSALSCSSQNLIYLLSCQACGQQYVGETTTKFSLRMNTHRTSKTGCEHVINHKKICSESKFTYQILEKLESKCHKRKVNTGGFLD